MPLGVRGECRAGQLLLAPAYRMSLSAQRPGMPPGPWGLMRTECRGGQQWVLRRESQRREQLFLVPRSPLQQPKGVSFLSASPRSSSCRHTALPTLAGCAFRFPLCTPCSVPAPRAFRAHSPAGEIGICCPLRWPGDRDTRGGEGSIRCKPAPRGGGAHGTGGQRARVPGLERGSCCENVGFAGHSGECSQAWALWVARGQAGLDLRLPQRHCRPREMEEPGSEPATNAPSRPRLPGRGLVPRPGGAGALGHLPGPGPARGSGKSSL